MTQATPRDELTPLFHDMICRFLDQEVAPHYDAWEEAGEVPRELWRRMGEAGLLGIDMPEPLGGTGADFAIPMLGAVLHTLTEASTLQPPGVELLNRDKVYPGRREPEMLVRLLVDEIPKTSVGKLDKKRILDVLPSLSFLGSCRLQRKERGFLRRSGAALSRP